VSLEAADSCISAVRCKGPKVISRVQKTRLHARAKPWGGPRSPAVAFIQARLGLDRRLEEASLAACELAAQP